MIPLRMLRRFEKAAEKSKQIEINVLYHTFPENTINNNQPPMKKNTFWKPVFD